MIQIQNVTKKFGKFTAVDDLNITIPQGQFFGFLGPNGAGKTTTIKMIVGLFTPTKGDIIVDGNSIIHQPLKAKEKTGYVPDVPFLYEKLTGREFLYFVGGLFNMQKQAIHNRIGELIDLFEIDSWIDKRTEDYSQGMKQRITITAALLHNPLNIIIDEPMVGLDPKTAKIVKETMLTQARNGTTIFMSTHSLSLAEELCDRIGIINQGKLVYCDTRENLQSELKRFGGKLESMFLELTKS